MSFVTKFEKNSMRKSYRTTIPLQVRLNGKTYSAIDWSLTGLALADLQTNFAVGEKVTAVLVLPMHDAHISLQVKLCHEYTEKGRSGFSFVDLSEKSRSVLRRFIELAIEGEVDRVDDIVAIYEEPQVDTPIQTPVKLQEEEARALQTAFRKTSLRYTFFALFVLALAAGLLIYNFRYRYEGSGVVAGNDLKIFPQVTAVIDKIYVKEGDQVTPGMPLADLDSDDIIYKLSLLEIEKKRKLKMLSAAMQEHNRTVVAQTRMIRLMEQKVRKKRTYYLQMKKEFDAQLITAETLREAENAWLEAKLQLQKQKAAKETLSVEKKADTGKEDIEDLNVRIDFLKKQLAKYRLFAPVRATVYEIYVPQGQSASKNAPLMLLWTEDTPYISATIPTKYFSDIHTGSKVRIIDRLHDKVLNGEVFKTAEADPMQQNETYTVFIRPLDQTVKLRPYQRVELLFEREW